MIKRIAVLSALITLFIQADIPEKPIVIIVPSRNNNELFDGVERYKLNLDSIFSQEYANYRVIYVDDCSDDGTADLVEDYIDEKGQTERVMLIKNSKRWGPSRNRYVATHLCDDNEIVMYLDGDDWFAHSSVLQVINKAYDDPNVWFTYSHFRHAPDDGKLSGGVEMPSWTIAENAYRKFGWYFHSLKTFYAWLFKRVKLEDLFYEGNFLPIASDMVETFPMAEMSGGRFKFIDEVLYIASVHQTNEMKIAGWDRFQVIYRHIVGMPPYEPFKEKPVLGSTYTKDSGVDLLWFCQTDLDELQDSLQDFKEYVTGIRNLCIIIDDTIAKESVNKALPDFPGEKLVVKQARELSDHDFLASLSDYVMFASGEHVPCVPLNVIEAARSMRMAYAYAFYFAKNAKDLEQWHNVPCFNIVFDFNAVQPLYVFQCGAAKQAFKSFNTIDCTLYSKATLKDLFSSFKGECIDDFIRAFMATGSDDSKIAMVYEQVCMLSIDRM